MKTEQTRVFTTEWASILIVMAIFLLFLIGYFYLEYNAVTHKEQNILSTQVEIINNNLVREIESIILSQRNIQNELRTGYKNQTDPIEFVKRRMLGFVEAIHTVRSMTLFDENGTVIYSTQHSIIGQNFSYRDYFYPLKDSPEIDKIFITKPYTTTTNVWTINISTPIIGSNGEFKGVITTALDQHKLIDLLSSVFYSSDMWASIAHGSGVLFLIFPENSSALGKDIKVKNSFLDQFLQSDQHAVVYSGENYATKSRVMIAISKVESSEYKSDNFLISAVARDLDLIYVLWKRNLTIVLFLYIVIFIISALSLYVSQKKREYLTALEERFKKDLISKNNQLERQSSYLESLAFLDGLTGVPNRRRFDELFDKLFLSAKREKLPLAVIMVDIDQFKNYNDFYGHQAGDECLKKVAKALATCVKRPLDLMARYGGEEFVILLANTDKIGAKKVAEKCRKTVEDLKIDHARSDESSVVTISLGVAEISDEIIDSEELLKNADKALYEAKKSGRNRVS